MPPAIPIGELRERRSRHRRTWPALVATATVVVLVISVVAILVPQRSTGVQVSTNQTVIGFSGNVGELAMAYQPGKPGALLVGSDFTDPGPDNVYEIWMLQGSNAVSGGCVRPHDGSIVAFADVDLSDTDQMAVTVEPDSCPSQPTTTPILVSDPLVA